MSSNSCDPCGMISVGDAGWTCRYWLYKVALGGLNIKFLGMFRYNVSVWCVRAGTAAKQVAASRIIFRLQIISDDQHDSCRPPPKHLKVRMLCDTMLCDTKTIKISTKQHSSCLLVILASISVSRHSTSATCPRSLEADLVMWPRFEPVSYSCQITWYLLIPRR